jgi:polyisoprenoid-binding protein YceI
MLNRATSVLRTHEDRLVPVAGDYEIDATQTAVEFVGRHMMINKVRGRFTDVRGRITIAEEPAQSHVEVEIGAGSVDTGNAKRDTHLRSDVFFDVERYQTIVFRSTSVQALAGSVWELLGDLTIRDTTQQVGLRVTFDGAEASPGADERIGFTATTEVNREDFGMTFNEALETGGVLIGRTVRIELSIQATPTTRTPAA